MDYMEHVIAGWIGGSLGLLVGHPIDTVKVRQQNYGTNMIEATRLTLRYEGIPGFYKGMFFPLLTVGASNAIFFGAYGNVLKTMNPEVQQFHVTDYRDLEGVLKVYTAGSIAGVFQILFTCPCELIKIVQQSNTGRRGKSSWETHNNFRQYKGSMDAMRGIIKDHGLQGLFRGLVPMLYRDIPTSGLFTLSYDLAYYQLLMPYSFPTLLKQCIAGGIAGIMSWVPVVPMDVIKSQMQAEDPRNPSSRTIAGYIAQNYKAGGIRIFFRGLPAITIRAIPSNAAIFVGYESGLSFLRKILPPE